jgi:hypothetical protein
METHGKESKMVRETEILREMYIDIVGDGDNYRKMDI